VIFYLGSHMPQWLEKTDVPLFISARRLRIRKKMPRARGPWALDSGGFSELSLFGMWETTPRQYIGEVRRWRSEIGGMRWAAIQDWMCEEVILQKTGKTVLQHQQLTIKSLLDLRSMAPELPWTPVLQGFTVEEYSRHLEMYLAAGIDLTREPLVGIGSVCRRQGTCEAEVIMRQFRAVGLRIHAFGVKAGGLRRYQHLISSADSMAWSFRATPPPSHSAASSTEPESAGRTPGAATPGTPRPP
jgi:hypothetical protein